MLPGFEKETADLNPTEIKCLKFVISILKLTKFLGPVTNSQIRKRLFLFTGIKLADSRVRKIIHEIRSFDLVNGLCASSKGYFVTTDVEILSKYQSSLEGRLTAIRKDLSYIKRQRANITGEQLKITIPKEVEVAA